MVTRTDGTAWDLASWTAYDKPRWLDNGAKGSEFIYGASSQRAVHLKYDKVGSAKHYKKKKIYVGGNFEIDFENQASGTSQDWEMKIARVYVDGPDGRSGAFEFDPQAATSADHKFYVYHQDHLGSIDAITDYDSDDIYDFSLDNASDEAVYSYDAWGKRRDPENWNVVNPSSGMAEGGDNDITPRGFTDHEMLDHVGLVHMNGRIYDPLLGRFLSADRLIDGVTTIQGFNRYSYVKNNPLSFTDPTGDFAITTAILIGIGIGAAIDVVSQMTIDNKSISEVDPVSVAISGAMGAVGGGGGAVVGALSKSAGKSIVKRALVRTAGNGLIGAGTGATEGAIDAERKGEDIWDGAMKGAGRGVIAGAAGSAAGDVIGAVGQKGANAVRSLLNTEARDPSTIGKVGTALEKASDFKPMDVGAAGTEGAVKNAGLASVLSVTKDTAGSVLGATVVEVGAAATGKITSDALTGEATAAAAAEEAARKAAEEAGK